MNAAQSKEVLDRVRRMETRLTRYLESQGFDTKTRKPYWKADGTVVIPSLATSIADCLAVVPKDWLDSSAIFIVHKGAEVMEFFLLEKESGA